MSLFDRLVDEALRNQKNLAPLRIVVEKELLQHDILRELSEAGLLTGLTFIGGTCLRLCYGSNRLSEDLDFAGGANFNDEKLASLARILEDKLKVKYGLSVEISEPTYEIEREPGSVATWKVKIQTRPEQRDLRRQRINIDICAIPSHDPQPMMLRNFYGVEMGTSGLILQAQSREEIFADKLIAFALRPNRLKHRDLWDMNWLQQQGVTLPLELVYLKLQDRHCDWAYFLEVLSQRNQSLQNKIVADDFRSEMSRFLPADLVSQTVSQPVFWAYLIRLVDDLCQQAIVYLSSKTIGPSNPHF